MLRFISRRLLVLPFALILVHFLGFAYPYLSTSIRIAHTPYYFQPTTKPPSLLVSYGQYIQDVFHGALFRPLEQGPQIGSFAGLLGQASAASLGLLAIVLALSITVGLVLGLLAVRNHPPGVRGWMPVISTVGLAMPSFYIGSLAILILIFLRVFVFRGSMNATPVPISGFGWDSHLVLPVIALVLHPTVQIAQVTASMLAGEMNKQYIIAARSFGHTWRDIRWRQALRNVIGPVILSIAGSFRLLIGELIVVEWLFSWPGLGNFLASTLIPGTFSTRLGATDLFLNPPAVAGVVTVLALIFIVSDLLAHIVVRIFDPRVNVHEEADSGGGVG